MSAIKQKRMEDGYEPHSSSNILVPQPLLCNSVVTVNGEQYLEIDPAQLGSGQNQQSNLLYFILPKDVTDAQVMPTVFIMPNNDQQTNELHINNSGVENNSQYIKIKQDLSDEEGVTLVSSHQESKLNTGAIDESEILGNYEQNGDPLQIREHIGYAVAKRYNDVVCETSAENVIKHNEFTWKTQIQCDYFPSCKVVLTSYYEKKLHMDDHKYPSNTAFKCSICNMVFDRAIDRNKHIESHSVPDTYRCDACLKRFPYYTSYVQHLHDENCAPSRSLTCLFCGLHFAHADDVQSHQILNTKTCVCNTKMCNNDTFDLHRISCPQYNKKLNHRFKKKQHVSTDVIVLD